MVCCPYRQKNSTTLILVPVTFYPANVLLLFRDFCMSPFPTREPSRQVRSSCITFFQPLEKLFRVFFADLTQLRFVDLCGSEGEGGGLRRGCFGFQRFVVVEYLRVLKDLKNLWGQVDSRCLNFSLDVVFVNFCTKTKNFHFCESSVVGSTESCLPIHGNVPLQASWL